MPTIDIPEKICSHCGGTKWILRTSGKIDCCLHVRRDAQKRHYDKVKNTDEFKKKQNMYSLNRYHRCKTDASFVEKRKSYRKPETSKKSYQKNKQSILLKQKEYQGRLSVREKIRDNSKKRCENLTDGYIIYTLTSNLKRAERINITTKYIPQDLIELKRKQLLLIRKIKQS